MATSIHADTSWQPPPIAQSGPRHSMSGSRRRALSIRRDQQCNRPPGSTSPLEVNVTMPAAGMHGLAFDKADLVNRAGHLRMNIYYVVGNYRADAGHYDRHIGGLDLFRHVRG
jgi:hypothetical protein